MELTITDIIRMLDSNVITPYQNAIVATGVLTTPCKKFVDYTLHHGWDPAKAYACDKSWGCFNVELMRFIKRQNYDEPSLRNVLYEIQVDDSHWEWLNKSLHYRSSEYDWFFLFA
jgi:hypothetical protein